VERGGTRPYPESFTSHEMFLSLIRPLVGAIERKKCKKLQFWGEKVEKQKIRKSRKYFSPPAAFPNLSVRPSVQASRRLEVRIRKQKFESRKIGDVPTNPRDDGTTHYRTHGPRTRLQILNRRLAKDRRRRDGIFLPARDPKPKRPSVRSVQHKELRDDGTTPPPSKALWRAGGDYRRREGLRGLKNATLPFVDRF